MSRIATCRSCHAPVTVPEGLDERQRVRCPLCQAECSLHDVLAEATEADDDSEVRGELVPVAIVSDEPLTEKVLPEKASSDEGFSAQAPEVDSSGGLETLVDEQEEEAEKEEQGGGRDESQPPVDQAIAIAAEAEAPIGEMEGPPEETADRDETDTRDVEAAAPPQEDRERPPDDEGPPDEGSQPLGQAAEPAEPAEEPPEPSPEQEMVEVRCPHCEAEFPLSQVVVVATGTELGPAVAAAMTRCVLTGDALAGEAPALDVWTKADGIPQIDLGAEARAPVVTTHVGAFDFARDDAEAEAGRAGVPSLRPRRRKPKSIARELAGWVFGGVAGLVIAYYLLNFIRGEAGNFLKIPLPGVSHTYQYSPDWFPSWLKPAPESEETASDGIADLNERYRHAQPGGRKAERNPEPVNDAPKPAGRLFAGDSRGGFGAVVPPPKEKASPDGYVGLVASPSYTTDACTHGATSLRASRGGA